MGKSLLDVQRELHIRAAHIAAIENGDLDAFEAPSFVAGFVRSYARYLDLEPEAVYARFCAEHGFVVTSGMGGAAAPRETRIGREPQAPMAPGAIKAVGFLPDPDPFWRRVEPGALGSITILLALIGGLGFAGWKVLQEVQRVTVAPADLVPNVVADLNPLAEEASAMAPRPIDTDPLTAPAGTGAVGQVRIARPEALDVPLLVPRDGPIASIGHDPSPDGPAISTQAAVTAALSDLLGDDGAAPTLSTASLNGQAQIQSPTAGAPQVLAGGPPVVQILAVRASWMRVRGADGSVVFERILDAGETWTLPQTDRPPTLHAGNSGSVYFVIDGQPYGPAAPGANVVRNLSLAVENLTGSFQVADLSRDSDLAVHVARLRTND